MVFQNFTGEKCMQSPLDLYIKKSPLVAILRGITPEEVPEIAETLLSQGIYIIEIPLNSPDRPFESIRILRDIVGDRGICGAGTVLNTEEVDQVAEVGGQLIVSPNCNTSVISRSLDKGMYSLPGCLTPTEVFQAIDTGTTHVKIFPGGDLGSVYIESIHAVIPKEITTYIVGGAAADNLAEFWAAGARAFGFGTNVYKPGDTAEIVAGKAKLLVDAANRLN